MYADNTQLHIIIDKQQHETKTFGLEACVKDIKSCCVSNKIVLNDGKTDILHSLFLPNLKLSSKV